MKQVKLTLGTNNSVITNGNTYALAFNSNADATVTLDVNQTVTANGTTELIVDFDANQSVQTQASGSASYTFTPVVRPINVDATASGVIMGHVGRTGIIAVVSVTGNGHTYSSTLAVDGYFRVRGLASGSYTVTVTPLLPLTAVTRTDIQVTSGQTTDMGEVSL